MRKINNSFKIAMNKPNTTFLTFGLFSWVAIV